METKNSEAFLAKVVRLRCLSDRLKLMRERGWGCGLLGRRWQRQWRPREFIKISRFRMSQRQQAGRGRRSMDD